MGTVVLACSEQAVIPHSKTDTHTRAHSHTHCAIDGAHYLDNYSPYWAEFLFSKLIYHSTSTVGYIVTQDVFCVCSPHLFQRSSSSPPQPQNALGNPLTFLNCLTVRPLTPPKNSLYGSLWETIIRIKFILCKGYNCRACP